MKQHFSAIVQLILLVHDVKLKYLVRIRLLNLIQLIISSCLDPCLTKNCGPYGECRDNQGTGICHCNDGDHLDGSPCQGKIEILCFRCMIFLSRSVYKYKLWCWRLYKKI